MQIPLALNHFVSLFLLSFGVGISCVAGERSPFIETVEELECDSFAEWIGPAGDLKEGLFYFRKTFELSNHPDSFLIHVSADPRYRLWVNGEWVSFGPAAGHYYHWNYETIDIAGKLKKGENVVAVEVRQSAQYAGPREISFGTAMIFKGPDVDGSPLLSDETWKVMRVEGWKPLPMNAEIAGGGYIAGATEEWDLDTYPYGWNQIGFDDSHWQPVQVLGKGSSRGLDTWLSFLPWQLQPRPIPLLDDEVVEIPASGLCRVEANGAQQDGWLDCSNFPLSVPAHRSIKVLFDLKTVDMGFPELVINGGAGSTVTVRYQEALFDEKGHKGNRNDIEGKTMLGIYDQIHIASSQKNLTWEPFWLRTFRFVELTFETAAEPLHLESFQLRRIRYPFQKQGAFESSDVALKGILDASWHTVELCALETYMDCPYYEQIQYIGDARIQALISLYLTGDDRLMRNAIQQFHDSMQPNGLTRSSFPVSGNAAQIIPPFSLVYIGMVHDFYQLRNDSKFVESLLPGVEYTLSWFLERLDSSGLLGPLPYWNHTDGGAQGFKAGSPPGAESGGSVQISLMLAIALNQTAEMIAHAGDPFRASAYRKKAGNILNSVQTLAWNEDRKWYSETPEQAIFSQHTNALAMLAGIVPADQLSDFSERLVSDPELIQGSLYFQFYIFEALATAHRSDLILNEMNRWSEMLEYGLTTFPEHGIESRSDVHAWAAHPLYHLLASVAGIRPGSPGFKTVNIEPHPGLIEHFSARAVHPEGLIEIEMEKQTNGGLCNVRVSLPQEIRGQLFWNGKSYTLEPGVSEFKLPNP